MSEQQTSGGSLKIVFGVIGIILGLPLSYFFQSPLIRKIPLSEYLKHIPQLLTNSGGTPEQRAMESAMIGNPVAVLVMTCVVCAIIGAVLGYFIDHSKKQSD
jgi:predicted PurR-regulated permease PerM